MKKQVFKTWGKAALIRAARTVLQTAAAMINTAVVLEDVNWLGVLSASTLACIVSLLTSAVTGLPEVEQAIMQQAGARSKAYAIAIRAIRTISQAAAGIIGTAVMLRDVDWRMLLSASLVAGLYSVLTSLVTGLPEAEDHQLTE